MVTLAPSFIHCDLFFLTFTEAKRRGKTGAKYQQREDICATGFLQTGAELQADLNLQNVFIMSTDRWRSVPFVAVDTDQIFSLHINWSAGAQFLRLCGFAQTKQTLVLGSSKKNTVHIRQVTTGCRLWTSLNPTKKAQNNRTFQQFDFARGSNDVSLLKSEQKNIEYKAL